MRRCVAAGEGREFFISPPFFFPLTLFLFLKNKSSPGARRLRVRSGRQPRTPRFAVRRRRRSCGGFRGKRRRRLVAGIREFFCCFSFLLSLSLFLFLPSIHLTRSPSRAKKQGYGYGVPFYGNWGWNGPFWGGGGWGFGGTGAAASAAAAGK